MNKNDWNSLVSTMPSPHFLQTWEWSEVKKGQNWNPIFKVWGTPTKVDACSLLLKRSMNIPMLPIHPSMIYLPKGPLLDWQNKTLRQGVVENIQQISRKESSIYVKMDPDVVLGTGIPGTADEVITPYGREVTQLLETKGWRYSTDQIQFKNTVMLDISGSEEEILAQMKQKTRYNIRLAERKGVEIQQAHPAELTDLYKMYAQTSIRDGFVIRPESYYQGVWETFMGQNMAAFLVAKVDGKPVAALFLVYFARNAWYLYGMSLSEHRDKMPNHLLQWHAILAAKKMNCTHYDLWGAPEVFNDTDPMWGVYRFKEGFNGKVTRTIGAWDFPIYPRLYVLYTILVPRILNTLRQRGIKQTRQFVQHNNS